MRSLGLVWRRRPRPIIGSESNYLLTPKEQSVWTYNVKGQLTSIQDRDGNQSTLTCNGLGQLIAVRDPAGRGSLTLGYDANGHLVTVTDWLSPARTVQFGYDSNGRLSSATDRKMKATITFQGPAS